MRNRKPLRRFTPLRSSKVSKAEVRGGRDKSPRPPLTAVRESAPARRRGTVAVVEAAGSASPSSLAPLAFPKPTKRDRKAPKPIARSWMRRSARGTKHSRRPREWGFMSFCHDRGCEMARDIDTQAIAGIQHMCFRSERIEFAHLSDLKRYDVGDVGAGLCVLIHRGIDGKLGGKAPWYMALGKPGQRMIRMRLADRARQAWTGLTPAQRAHWDEIGEQRRQDFARERTQRRSA